MSMTSCLAPRWWPRGWTLKSYTCRVLGIDSLLFGQGFPRLRERVQPGHAGHRARRLGAALPGPRADTNNRAGPPLFYSWPPPRITRLTTAREITFRKFGLYPPFCAFVRYWLYGGAGGAVLIAAQRFGSLLAERAAQRPGLPLRILGPAP